MKQKNLNSYCSAVAVPLLFLSSAMQVRAVTSTWVATANASWDTPASWSGSSSTFGVDEVLDFSTLNITGNIQANLTTNKTAGTLKFADTSGADGNWLVRQVTLTLATTSGKPVIDVANQFANFGSIVAGTQGFEKTGNGTVGFTNFNTHTGGIVVTGGTLSVFNSTSAVDTMLGAVPGSPSAANITLAAGTTFANRNVGGLGSNLTLNANRGITLTGGGVATFNVMDSLGTGLGTASTVTVNGAITGSGTVNHTGNDNSKLVLNGNISTSSGGVTNSNGSLDIGGVNTYTGDTSVNVGTVSLLNSGQLGDTDSIVASGATMLLIAGSQYNMVLNGLTTTTITGAGTIFLAGEVNFDLALASIANGNTWQVVDNSTLVETYTGSFQVNGFTQLADVWTKTSGANTWTFTESTGVLSLAVVPEPSAALLGGLGILGLLRRRRN